MVKHVKAAYIRGTQGNIPNSSYIIPEESIHCEWYGSIGRYDYMPAYIIQFEFKRINNRGNGVSLSSIGMSAEIYLTVETDNEDRVIRNKIDVAPEDVIPIKLFVDAGVREFDLRLKAGNIEADIDLNLSEMYSFVMSDYADAAKWRAFQRDLYEGVMPIVMEYMNEIGLKRGYTARTGVTYDFETARQVATSMSRIAYFYNVAKAEGQTDPYSYTWYQIQYAIITCTSAAKTVYLTPAEAEAYCKENYPWCAEDNIEEE